MSLQEWIGDRDYYETFYKGREPAFYSWLLVEVIKYGRPGSILELGCGTGLFVELAHSWGIDVRGCDGSEDAIEIALHRCPYLNVSQLVLGDGLPFDTESFDNIVLNEVIEHLPAEISHKVLAESNRLLRKGGMMFIYSPSKANKKEVEKDPTHCNPLLPSELRKLLINVGFKVIAEPNSPRVAVNSRLVRFISTRLIRTAARDWLSATANAYARKV